MLLRNYYFIFFTVFSLMLSACTGEPETGPVDVRWDQNTCERCRMMLSDRHFSAQIRYFPEAKKSRVVKFDDIGCATLWLKEQKWKNDPKTEIWVTAHSNGEWINARKATYIRKNNSPMGYNLGAQAEAEPGGLNFAEAEQHIEQVEKKFNTHGMQHEHVHHPEQDLKQQGMSRDSAKQ